MNSVIWTFALVTNLASSLALVLFLPALPELWSYLFNADALFLPALWEHLFVQKGSWASWYPSVVGFYFPDMIIASIARTISRRSDYAVYIFFMLQQLMIGLAFAIFLRREGKTRESGSLLTLAPAFFVALLLINLNLVHSSRTNSMESVLILGPLIASAHHTGTIFSTLLGFHLFLRVEKEPKKFLWVMSWTLLNTVAVASDKLYIASAIGPMLAYALLKLLLGKMNSVLLIKITLLSIIATVMGHQMWILIGWWHRPAGVTGKFASLPAIHGSLTAFMKDASFFFTYEWLCISISIGFGLFLLALNLFRWLKDRKSDTHSDAGVILLFGALLPLAASIFKGLYSDLTSFRYLESLIILPVFWAWGWFVEIRWKPIRTISILAIFTFTVFTIFKAQSLYSKYIIEGYYPPLVACLDALPEVKDGSLKYGYTDYWNAKPIRLFSKHGLKVAQLNTDSKDQHWISSDQWTVEVDSALIQGSKFFIVKTRLDSDSVEKRFGSPEREVSCANEKVKIYDSLSE